MVELVKKYEDKENLLRDKINELGEGIKYLKEFIVDPYQTSKAIQNSQLPIAESFSDIEHGLTGEFTKSQAVEIGKKKLIDYYRTVIDNINENNITIGDFAESIAKDLKEQLEIVNRNVDITILNRRKTRSLTNTLTKEFLLRKMKVVLEAKAREYNSSKQPSDFLFTLREIMAKIRLGDIQDIKTCRARTNFDKHNLIKDITRVGVKGVDFETYSTQVELSNKSTKDVFEELLYELGDEHPAEDMEIEILVSIIDSIDRTYDAISKNIEELVNEILTYKSDEELVSVIIKKLYEEVLEPYSKIEITSEEFTKKSLDLLHCLNNVLVLGRDIRYSVLNMYKTYLQNIEIYGKIYSIIDEVTLRGQLEGEGKV